MSPQDGFNHSHPQAKLSFSDVDSHSLEHINTQDVLRNRGYISSILMVGGKHLIPRESCTAFALTLCPP